MKYEKLPVKIPLSIAIFRRAHNSLRREISVYERLSEVPSSAPKKFDDYHMFLYHVVPLSQPMRNGG
ncbi:hypothetical protein GOP47_0018811 [Adiantum capillus-veneris]|uniref:Uncharacterized protein n=1 Tax=Adiantum capillus-veneris TaxID=13818 RepID=A0A9D4Z9Z2_ADICA|nr:hypothetical protein GOP47_0018811 [Adiantum capillus-veneris]